MFKTFKQFLNESTDKLSKEIKNHMHDEYYRVAYDLPKFGDDHYNAAHDYVRDNAYDTFHKHPKFDIKKHNLKKLAKQALKNIDDDRKETQAKYKKQNNEYKKNWINNKFPKKPTKAQLKSIQPKMTPGGKYTIGYRKGIGSE